MASNSDGDSVTATGAGARAGRSRGSVLATTIVAVLCGLLVSAQAARWNAAAIDASVRARYEQLAERVRVEVAQRFNLPVYGLKGARGLLAATWRRLTRSEFRR